MNKHFDNPADQIERPPLRYNDFGWTFGGPIFIPGHYNTDRKKTFFFYSEEIRRIRESTTRIATVPNADERAGRFASPVCTVPVFDPDTGACIGPATTVINPANFNPAAVAYLKDVYSHIPLPQDPVNDTLTIAGKNRFDYRQEIFRVDHALTQKIQLTGRYINDSIPTVNPAGLFDQSSVLGYATTSTDSPGRSLLIRSTQTLTNSIANETAYAWSYGGVVSQPIGLNTFAASPNVASAITLPFSSPLARIPNLNFSSASGLFGFGPYRDFNRNHNIFDNLSWVKGRHTMQFGVTYHRYQKQENDAGANPSNGSFTFNNTDPTGTGTFPQEWANFLLGNVSSFTQTAGDFHAEIRQHMLEIYAQDTFRWRPNLTVMYGLRWTRYGQPFDANGRNTSFYPPAYNPANAPTIDADGNLCLPSTVPCSGGVSPNPHFDPLNGIIIATSNSPFGEAVQRTSNKNFAPRIGLSWDPAGDGKTAIRTGYGLFFDSPAVGFVENNLFVNPPFVSNVTFSSTTFDKPESVSPDPLSSPQFVKGVAQGWQLPYTQSWSLDVQHEFPKNFVLDVGYYGNKGTHLIGILDVNQPRPGAFAAAGIPGPITNDTFAQVNRVRPFQGYGPINESATVFNSNYHGLQVGMQKRFSGSSQMSVSYTWSHALTDAGSDFASPLNIYNIRADYGPTDFDRRHMFNFNFVYELPWYKNQEGFAGHWLGGWELSGIVTYYSGLFLTPTGTFVGIDPAGIGYLDPNTNGRERTVHSAS